MELKKEFLKGGVYDNYIVHLDERVSYCINFLDKDGCIRENDETDSDQLQLILNAIASLLKGHPHTNVFSKGDEIIIGDINIEFFRRYIKLNEEDFSIIINYEFVY